MRYFCKGLGLLTLACLFRLDASPITYSITTTATGTLGASIFTNASITLTLTGNTSGVTAGPGQLSVALINPGTATVTIGGLGSATITDSVEIVSDFNATLLGQPGVVIVDTTNGGPMDPTGILWTLSPTLLGYNLQTAIGPVAGTGGVANQGPVDGFFSTGRGNLQFAAGQGGGTGTSTFTASTVPEPGALALVVASFAMILCCRLSRSHSKLAVANNRRSEEIAKDSTVFPIASPEALLRRRWIERFN